MKIALKTLYSVGSKSMQDFYRMAHVTRVCGFDYADINGEQFRNFANLIRTSAFSGNLPDYLPQ